jgi:hypothetical protein
MQRQEHEAEVQSQVGRLPSPGPETELLQILERALL